MSSGFPCEPGLYPPTISKRPGARSKRRCFYLDNDVDARGVHGRSRSQDITAGRCAARSGDAPDDDQTIYAIQHGAVVVTRDREFTERRKRTTIGRHVRLCCEQPDGPNVIDIWLADVRPVLKNRPHVVVELYANGYSVHTAWL